MTRRMQKERQDIVQNPWDKALHFDKQGKEGVPFHILVQEVRLNICSLFVQAFHSFGKTPKRYLKSQRFDPAHLHQDSKIRTFQH